MMDWDRTIAIGDLITSYYSGYWRVDRIERRFTQYDHGVYEGIPIGTECSPVFYMTEVLTDTGKPRKRKNSCDAWYCKKVTHEWVDEQIRNYVELMTTIRNNI